MPKIPRQRNEDEKGNGGRLGQTQNRNDSNKRGGRPHAGGAGTDEKPKKG